jgi:hypothetical protein
MTQSYIWLGDPDGIERDVHAVFGDLPGVDTFVRHCKLLTTYSTSGRGIVVVLRNALEAWAPGVPAGLRDRFVYRLVTAFLSDGDRALLVRAEALDYLGLRVHLGSDQVFLLGNS